MKRLALILVLLLLGISLRETAAWDNGLALTPPMGWSSWNYFACNINETDIVEIAQAMVKNGMKDAGYQYVNVDDCWQVDRFPNGTIMADPDAFPHGIAWLADQVHALGLKFGIYTCAGTLTCQGRPGSKGYECIDAATYAEWGVDFIKEDWCNTQGMKPEPAYSTMSACINETNTPMLFSICDWGRGNPWDWAEAIGNMWRTTQDIKDFYRSMLLNYDLTKRHVKAAGPGAWNDPDMLEVGNGGMTNVEYQTHFSLWAMLAAPLIAGNDIRAMDNDTAAILLAAEVIAIDQDPLGLPMEIVEWDELEGRELLARPLQCPSSSTCSAKYAVVLFNRSFRDQTIKIQWSQIDPSLSGKSGCMRNVWLQQDIGCDSSYAATVASHGVSMITVTFS